MKGTLVILSSVHWNFTWQRHHDISSGFANMGYKVIFIEPIPKRWPTIRDANRVWNRLFRSDLFGKSSIQEIPTGVSIVSPIMLPDTGPFLHLLNRKILLPGLLKKISNSIVERPVFLINYLPIPTSLDLQKGLSPDVSSYDCCWDWENDPVAPHMHLCEHELINSCDLVFADSPFLYKKMQLMHKQTYRVLPAAQYDLFECLRLGYKKKINKKPVLAYFGNLKTNIDVELLIKVSQNYKLVIIGPKPPDTSSFSSSTVFYGQVPHQDIPKLLSNVDVLLLPYKRARHTPAVIPAKTFECLATGLPIVVTGLDSLNEFLDNFYLCEAEDVQKNVNLAFKESNQKRDKRLELARQNDWKGRVKEIEEYFQTMNNLKFTIL